MTLNNKLIINQTVDFPKKPFTLQRDNSSESYHPSARGLADNLRQIAGNSYANLAELSDDILRVFPNVKNYLKSNPLVVNGSDRYGYLLSTHKVRDTEEDIFNYTGLKLIPHD
jgi:hypothetical protein